MHRGQADVLVPVVVRGEDRAGAAHRPWRWGAGPAKVHALNRQVPGIHAVVAVEIGSWVVARLAARLAVGALEDGHVAHSYDVIAVAIPASQEAHLHPDYRGAPEVSRARRGQVLRPAHPPGVEAVRKARDGIGEEAAAVRVLYRVISLSC